MKNNRMILALSTLLVALPLSARSENPGAMISDSIQASATVEKIDKNSRMLTLRNDAGQEISVKAGPQVRNFDQIKPGDKVNANYTLSVALSVLPKGGEMKNTVDLEGSRAQLGKMPQANLSETITVTGTIEDVNRADRTLSIRGPEGNLRMVKFPEEMQPQFNQLQKGQLLQAKITESVALSVERQR